MEKRIGKIGKVKFGHGGYQEAMIGISFNLESDGWGVQDFWGTWAMERSDHHEWTQDSRRNHLGDMVMKINSLLEDAKKTNISDLKDVPVEVLFNGNSLTSWRILTEVL